MLIIIFFNELFNNKVNVAMHSPFTCFNTAVYNLFDQTVFSIWLLINSKIILSVILLCI